MMKLLYLYMVCKSLFYVLNVHDLIYSSQSLGEVVITLLYTWGQWGKEGLSNLSKTNSKNDSVRVIEHKSNNKNFNIFFGSVYMEN